MKIIVGLGNIGTEYDMTRHNVGFLALDTFATEKAATFKPTKKFFGDYAEIVAQEKIILLKPSTLMNRSGDSVRAVCDFYKVQANDVIVVHDEVDLEFGDVRAKQGGGSAGHNGVQSVIDAIGNDFTRIRIGINNDLNARIDTSDFVLAKFTPAEQEQLPEICEQAIKLLQDYLQ